MSAQVPADALRSGRIRSLVLRAWLEPGIPRLRVRIAEIHAGRDERSLLVTTSIEEACRAVRSWLETLQGEDANGNGDGAVTRNG